MQGKMEAELRVARIQKVHFMEQIAEFKRMANEERSKA